MNKITCPECNGKKERVYSCCTGEHVDDDAMMCPECHEHLGEEPCFTCNGEGVIEEEEEEKQTFAQSIIEGAIEMGKLVGMMSRKREGTDCTEEESAFIKGYLRENSHTLLARDLAEVFPLESSEVLLEKSENDEH
jgi:hypothetical protein